MGGSRLDNYTNNSHGGKAVFTWTELDQAGILNKDSEPAPFEIADKVKGARAKAKRQAEWAKSHKIVNKDTGETLTDKNGEPVTIASVSRSWYLETGGRNNARLIVQRLQKTMLHPANVKEFRPKFVTLTFAKVEPSWKIKRAIQKFLNACRTWANRKGAHLAYFWTAEVQERRALHYHIVFLGMPYLPKAKIEEWWPHGFIDVRAVDDLGRVFKYLAKYLWKWGKMAGEPDDLPDWWYYFSIYGKRRYGFSTWFRLPIIKRLPAWLRDELGRRDLLGICVKATRPPGGGWELKFDDPKHNEQFSFHLDSPYSVVEAEA